MPIEFTKPTVMATAAGLQGFGDGPGSEVVYGRRKLAKDVAAIAGGYRGDITINVYANDHMNVRDVAVEVRRELIRTEDQGRKVWA